MKNRAALTVVVLLILATLAPLSVMRARAVGPALYPDLRNAQPSNLYFDREVLSDGRSHYVLRFSNIVWNGGEGRLEIQGDPNPSGSNLIYQNIYDARRGGNRIIQRQVSSDLIYHPSHYHYHFQGFASYLLLQRDASGVYKPTTKRGTKTSFCVMDTSQMLAGAGSSIFTSCGNRLQGLTVGWGDNYPASLPDQWIDLGLSPLANGAYAVQSTADPQNKISEAGRDGNNVGITYFSVTNGRITIGRTPSPACSISPSVATVGSSLPLVCSGFRSGERVNFYLDSTSSSPLTGATASSTGVINWGITVPPTRGGSHTVIAVGNAGTPSLRVGLTVLPSLSRSPAGGPPGAWVTVTAQGFGANETIKLNWNSPYGLTLSRFPTDGVGTGRVRIQIPRDTLGWHDYTGFGYTSRLRAYGAIEVLASYPPGVPDPSFAGSALPIASSSGSSNATSSSLVHDGNMGTTWVTTSSIPPTGASFTLDLGSQQRLSGVQWVHSVTGTADEFLIQTSPDNVSWRTVGRFGGGTVGAWYGQSFLHDARYVRFSYLNPNRDPVLGNLAEVQVWGIGAAFSARVAAAPQATVDATTEAPTEFATATSTPTDPPTATTAPTEPPPTDVPTEVPAPTETPTLEPTAEATLPPILVTGTITGTGGDGAVCRSDPSTDGERLAVLPEGSPVGLTGNAVNDFYPVICGERAGFVSFQYVTLPGQEPPEPTTEAPPTPTPELSVREITVPVSGDTSVSAAQPDTSQPVEQRAALPAGGPDGAIAVLTFEVSGVAAGTVTDAKLVLPGAGDAALGGTLAVLPNTWVDADIASYTPIVAAGPQMVTEVGTIAASEPATVDVTGVLTGDGGVTFLVYGTPEQTALLASSEGGNPAQLVLVVEESVTPSDD